jgi:spore coat polysaccharide biosynthesis predicted glycosyltransferase SpsG
MWIVYLDDTGRSHIKADVVLNTSILAEPSMYPHVPRKLLGLEHFFLATEDALLCDQHNHPEHNKTADSAKHKIHSMRVVMTFGGSDPTGLTINVLAAIKRLHLPLSLSIVLGPGFASTDEIRVIAEQIDARVLVAPQRLLPILSEADLVICAGGRTLYECATLGLPVLAVASTPEEAKSVRAFANRGLIHAGLETWDENSFTKELKKICTVRP